MITTAIIVLALIGVVLILLEFFVVPGMLKAGIGGIACLLVATYLTYHEYGSTAGHFMLFGLLVLIIASVTYFLQADTWKKISLKTEITSKIDPLENLNILCGDRAITISRLAPTGKILINDTEIEAEAQNKFIDQNVEVEIIKILNNKVLVKTVN